MIAQQRADFELSDDLKSDIAAVIRRGLPSIDEAGLESALQGFERIFRASAERTAQAQEAEVAAPIEPDFRRAIVEAQAGAGP